jgi:hypothetical protein
MKAGILVLIFLGFCSLVFWNTARTNRSWLSTGFGESTGNRPEEDAYFAAARTALDQWLLSHGYAPGVSVATPAAGMHSGTESTMAYRTAEGAAEPVTVLVTVQTGNASGLQANVHWEYVGFRWTVDRHEALAKEVIPPISAWWKDYKEKHPRR